MASSMAYDGAAFCPGHITGFFEVFDSDDPLKKGSRGAGVCLSLGVFTGVLVERSKVEKIVVRNNGEKCDAPVTRSAIKNMNLGGPYSITVNSEISLPVSQGFGMSAAGALSVVLALNDALNLSLDDAEIVQIAHRAEVENLTGLGDVYPAFLGGMTFREKGGAPPYGKVSKKEVDEDLVLCVVGPKLETKRILTNPKVVERINQVGRNCIERFDLDEGLPSLIKLSREFALACGFVKGDLNEALHVCDEFGSGSISMLGNSVFALGDTEKLSIRLLDYGPTFICKIDNEGARVLG